MERLSNETHNFDFTERASDSPLVERIWHTITERPVSFNSIANTHWEMVITRYQGETIVNVHGPETRATHAESPVGAEYFGIIFKMGTYMPHLPINTIMDRNDADLPIASAQSFWLHGSTWEIPNFENADTFIKRLIRHDILMFDPVVDATLQNRPLDISLRTAQRRVKQVTGLTHKTIQQIERARQTAKLLENGLIIADAIYHAGYYDQSHLTNALTRYIGQTPAQILRQLETI